MNAAVLRLATGGGRRPLGLTACAALVAALVLLPLGFTLWQAISYGGSDAAELLLRPIVARLAGNTALIVLASTASCAVAGTASAWLVERTRLPGHKLWALLCVAPLAIPPFITSFAWVSISPELQGFWGAWLVLTTAYTPLVYLPVSAVLRNMDPALEETARALGLSPWSCFLRVTLPQLKPALLGGMLLVALSTLSEFGAFMLLHFHTFTTEIYAEYRASFDSAGASLLASVLMAAGVLILLAELRVRGQGRYQRLDRGARRAAGRLELGWKRWPALAWLLLQSAATLLAPIATILYWTLQPGADAVTPAEVSPQLLLSATASSLGLGLSAAALTTLLALPLGYLLARHPGRLAHLLERVVYLAQGVPGIVIALALVNLAIQWLKPLYQTAAMLALAYAIMFLPLALVSVRSALLQAESRLEELARSLGLNWWQALWRVVLPLAAPGLGAAASLVFISVITELTATLLLAPIGTETLATQVWADTAALAFAASAPYAAILIALSLSATWLLMSCLGRGAVLGGQAQPWNQQEEPPCRN
ncbi:Ferric iron ABC transporter permease protein [Chromobacterium vaccinii]|nr:Ferric iron ABC transporter permease protein [Chromobacterium vaccinii]QND91409.1 Ferric iron ABC transporter permease protein [Chromobacterium vaccinii]